MDTPILNDKGEEGIESVSHTSFSDETVIWSGSPSQWLNLGTFLFYGFLWVMSLVFVILWHGSGYNIEYIEYEKFYNAVVISFAVVPPLVMAWAWIRLRSEKITITRNKITETSGVTAIFRREKYCELGDVKDILSPPAGLLALVGRASLILETSDDDQPIINIRAIKGRDQLRDILIPLKRQLRVERKTYFGGK